MNSGMWIGRYICVSKGNGKVVSKWVARDSSLGKGIRKDVARHDIWVFAIAALIHFTSMNFDSFLGSYEL